MPLSLLYLEIKNLNSQETSSGVSGNVFLAQRWYEKEKAGKLVYWSLVWLLFLKVC